jgi:hypothetical protein
MAVDQGKEGGDRVLVVTAGPQWAGTYTLSAFRRRLHAYPGTRDVVREAGRAHWLPAQTHAGENIGSTLTHVLFVELKDGPANGTAHRDGAIRGTADTRPAQDAVGPT